MAIEIENTPETTIPLFIEKEEWVSSQGAIEASDFQDVEHLIECLESGEVSKETFSQPNPTILKAVKHITNAPFQNKCADQTESNKITVIKVIRAVSGCDLKEAKMFYGSYIQDE